MKLASRTSRLIHRVGVTGLTFLCLLLSHSSSEAKEWPRRTPVWEKVALIPFTIAPRAMEGAPARSDEDAIVQRLSAEAGTRAEHLLLKHRVAAIVEHAAPSMAASSPATPDMGTPSMAAPGTTVPANAAPVFVTGTISLPISLPRGVIGLRASSQDGVFAKAMVLLTNAAGEILAQEEVALNWSDVWWLQGGRAKRNISLDEVLMKFTRKAVDRAVERLARHDLAASGG